MHVIPGGNSVGIKLYAEGLLSLLSIRGHTGTAAIGMELRLLLQSL